MTVKLSESGYDTGLTFEEACKLLEEVGLDSPRDFGYTEEEVTWLGDDYIRYKEDHNWPEGVPYWYVSARKVI